MKVVAAFASLALLTFVAGCAEEVRPPKSARARVATQTAPRVSAASAPPNMVMLDYRNDMPTAPAPTIAFDPPPPTHFRLHQTLTIGKNNPDPSYEMERSEFEPEPLAYDQDGSTFSSDFSYAFGGRGYGGRGGHHHGANNPALSAPTPHVGGNWPSAPAYGAPSVLMMAPGK